MPRSSKKRWTPSLIRKKTPLAENNVKTTGIGRALFQTPDKREKEISQKTPSPDQPLIPLKQAPYEREACLYVNEFMKTMFSSKDYTIIDTLVTLGKFSLYEKHFLKIDLRQRIILEKFAGLSTSSALRSAWETISKSFLVERDPTTPASFQDVLVDIMDQIIPAHTRDVDHSHIIAFKTKVEKHCCNHLIARLIKTTHQLLIRKDINNQTAILVANEIFSSIKDNPDSLDGLLDQSMIDALHLEPAPISSQEIDAFIQKPIADQEPLIMGMINRDAFEFVRQRCELPQAANDLEMEFIFNLEESASDTDKQTVTKTMCLDIIESTKMNEENLVTPNTSCIAELTRLYCQFADMYDLATSDAVAQRPPTPARKALYQTLERVEATERLIDILDGCIRTTILRNKLKLEKIELQFKLKLPQNKKVTVLTSPDPEKTHPNIIRAFKSFEKSLYHLGKQLFGEALLSPPEASISDSALKKAVLTTCSHFFSFALLIAPDAAQNSNIRELFETPNQLNAFWNKFHSTYLGRKGPDETEPRGMQLAVLTLRSYWGTNQAAKAVSQPISELLLNLSDEPPLNPSEQRRDYEELMANTRHAVSLVGALAERIFNKPNQTLLLSRKISSAYENSSLLIKQQNPGLQASRLKKEKCCYITAIVIGFIIGIIPGVIALCLFACLFLPKEARFKREQKARLKSEQEAPKSNTSQPITLFPTPLRPTSRATGQEQEGYDLLTPQKPHSPTYKKTPPHLTSSYRLQS